MEKTNTSTRRTFIQTAGAALTVPVAAAAVRTEASAAPAGESLETRLARFEDREAIRALNQEFAHRINTGDTGALAELYVNPSGMQIDAALRAMTPEDFDAEGAIEIARDRQTAAATVPCSAQFEHEIGPDCTLVDMAREQGGGVVRHTDLGVFEHTYVRREGVWRIDRSAYRAGRPSAPEAT